MAAHVSLLHQRKNLRDDQVMSEAPSATEGRLWAAWVKAQLADRNRKQQWLADRSDGRIGAPQISRWLNRGERPRPETVVLVADLLSQPRRDALRAAGYEHLADSFEGQLPPEPADPGVERILALGLSKRATRRLLEAREAAMEAEEEKWYQAALAAKDAERDAAGQ